MNIQLKTKCGTLPKEVYGFLFSDKSADLNILISEKYHLNLQQIKVFSDLIGELFLKEILASSLVEEIKHIYGFNDSVARQMACDIAGVRLLVVADWLGTDVAGLIKSWGGDPAKYQSHVLVQQKAVIKEAEDLQKELTEPIEEPEQVEDEIIDDENIDWRDREQKIKALFSGNLVETLKLDDDNFLADINDSIFYLILNVNDTIQNELASLLFNNQEIITSQRLVLDGRQVDGTIANWLAYFINQVGGEMFNTVDLSDFMTNSSNAKVLDDEEKELLSSLLLVYRNLKFFPNNLSSDDPKNWMIFPLTHPETIVSRVSNYTKETVARPTIKANRVLERPQVVVNQPQISPEIKAQMDELTVMLNRYPEGSLERLSVEEEIERLRK